MIVRPTYIKDTGCIEYRNDLKMTQFPRTRNDIIAIEGVEDFK